MTYATTPGAMTWLIGASPSGDQYPTVSGGTTGTAGNSMFATAGNQELVLIHLSCAGAGGEVLTFMDHAGITLFEFELTGLPSQAFNLGPMKLNAGVRVGFSSGSSSTRFGCFLVPLLQATAVTPRAQAGFPILGRGIDE